jgi:hypothetical protein
MFDQQPMQDGELNMENDASGLMYHRYLLSLSLSIKFKPATAVPQIYTCSSVLILTVYFTSGFQQERHSFIVAFLSTK